MTWLLEVGLVVVVALLWTISRTLERMEALLKERLPIRSMFD